MGSFNTTCMISNTPILPEQDVRVFFLVMTPISDYKKRLGL